MPALSAVCVRFPGWPSTIAPKDPEPAASRHRSCTRRRHALRPRRPRCGSAPWPGLARDAGFRHARRRGPPQVVRATLERQARGAHLRLCRSELADAGANVRPAMSRVRGDRLHDPSSGQWTRSCGCLHAVASHQQRPSLSNSCDGVNEITDRLVGESPDGGVFRRRVIATILKRSVVSSGSGWAARQFAAKCSGPRRRGRAPSTPFHQSCRPHGNRWHAWCCLRGWS
jgi:hypothetical protein